MKMMIGGYTNPLVVEKIKQYKKDNMSEKKLFYVVEDGENSITVAPEQLEGILLHGLTEHNAEMPEEELPVFTVSPVYMTQEEYDNMPEYNG